MILSLAKLLGACLRPLQFLVYLLAGLYPRNRRLWVFGSWSGERYGDNAAALFEHVALHGSGEVRAIWITRDPTIVDALRTRGYQAYLARSLAGAWYCLNAGIYVYDGLTRDINHWLSRGARRVLLRHGVGIKRVERGIQNRVHRLGQLFHGNPLQKLMWSWLLPWHLVHPDLVIASSVDHARQGELYFGVGPERTAITGLPRNDQVLAPGAGAFDPATRDWIVTARHAGRPVVLYLPTFRDAGGLPFRWDELADVARNADVALLVKLHFVDAARHVAPVSSAAASHLRVIDPTLNPNRLFRDVDGLVSDYSSVVYDFMLTRKPVIFFVPDLERYAAERGLYYEFADVMPGPRPRDLAGLRLALADLARRSGQPPDDDYLQVLARFHRFLDTGSCERTYREILSRFVPGGAPVVIEA